MLTAAKLETLGQLAVAGSVTQLSLAGGSLVEAWAKQHPPRAPHLSPANARAYTARRSSRKHNTGATSTPSRSACF